MKGPHKLKIKFYAYKKTNNKKVLESTNTYTKKGGNLKWTQVDYKGKKLSDSTNIMVHTNLKKDYYKDRIASYKNIKSTYFPSLKSTWASNSGSTSTSNSGLSGGRFVYIPPEMGMIYSASANSGRGGYVYGTIRSGRIEWRPGYT